MRYIIIIIFASCCMQATAQETDAVTVLPKQRKNEIGILTDLGLTNKYNSGVGLQYKHWVKADYQAIRANINYSQFFNSPGRVYFPAMGDTIFSKHTITEIPTINIGLGIEMQRHFYKHIYMYAAIDLYAVYGKGNTKELFEKEVAKNDVIEYSHHYEGPGYNSTIFKVGLLPLVGVKFQFSRISFGTELSGLQIEYNALKHSAGAPGNGGGVADISMGDFTQRIFVNFRF